MISWPRNEVQQRWAIEFIQKRAGTVVPLDSHFLFWLVDGVPVWVVAFYGWSGKTVQGAFASNKTRMFPRELIRALFFYAFRVQKVEMLFAGVNSTNPVSEKIQRWLGFTELYRGKGLQSDGGDMILFGMRPTECRWLPDEDKNVIPEAETRAAA